MTDDAGRTNTPKMELAVLVPSLTVTVMGAMPIWPGAGVSVTVRLLLLPPKRMLLVGRRVGFAELAERVRVEAGVSASPTVNGMGAVETLIKVFVGGIEEMTGAVFAGSTVTVKEVLLDFPPVSMTQTVMMEEPAWGVAVTLTVRLAPLPPKAMLPFGIIEGLAEMPLSVRFAAGSSASRTVKESGPVD